ncbi:hypothetical protein TRP66_23010 [Pseudomonas sp. JDS28PS106]|uniref:hypothetical protein n=1 Tax=Pseudomonas sp. JDS28PS106 TaxID=2497235 RepID=UPI002FD67C66
MKSETSVSVVFPDVIPVVCRSLTAALLACVAWASTPAMADNAIRFSGSVVNATCNIQSVNAHTASEGQRLTLAPGVSFQVDTSRNACDGQAAPFIAHYTPVQHEAPQTARSGEASGSENAAVVTLTYQ